MNIRIASFSILAAALLAACADNSMTVRPAMEPSARIATQSIAYRPGSGVIQSVTPAPAMGTASAGGSAVTNRPQPPVGTEGNRAAAPGAMQRLAIRMDNDGAIQYVDTDATQFQRGMRVELTPDHYIRQL